MELPHLVFSGSHQYTFQHPQFQMKKAANQHQMPSQKEEASKNSSSSGYHPFHYFGFQNTHFSFLPSHLVLLLPLLFQSFSKKTSKWYRISNLEETWKENSSMSNKPFGHFRFKNKFRLRIMLLLIVLAFCPALSLPSNETVIKKSDYQALLAIKRALIDRRGVLMSWNDNGLRACSGEWTGIKCIGSRVIAIQLPWMGLSGQISDMIGRLEALRRISLHDNFFKGEIPSSLGLLPNLRLLSLSNNRLSGSIPLSIGNCLKLRNLDLSKNFLSGVIPDSLFNLTRLYRLNLSYNGLVGPVPMNITHAHSLVFLDLQQNNFSGSIPSSLGRLGMLEEIYLNGNNFTGGIPEEIGKLGRLRILDLSNNGIAGTFSTSLCNLSTLVRLDLENNHLKSHIPETINRMQNLSVLFLRRNQFEGPIPSTLGNLPELSQLDFSENKITGSIPKSLSSLPNLESFNVSYNHLSGSVPFLLSKKFNSSSFKGNLQLCGYSASVPCPSPPPLSSSAPLSSIENTPVQKPHHGKVRTRDIILIAVALFLLFFSVLLCFIRKRSSCSQRSSCKSSAAARKGRKEEQVIRAEVQTGEDAGGKLVHFDGPLAFTADDLLCATAEIMGKSNYGTVYKATLEEGNQVAVKRLKEKFTKNQREFEDEVYALGKIRHENLLALRAYYLGPKGEKLLVFDYMPKGSLASFLHARGPDTVISWPVRMGISIDTTRGLCHLHTHVNMVHGNLTSGSILLDEQNKVKIADFGLSKLMANGSECDVIATAGTLGYRAPELSKVKIANTKTDVYSLGVIILELLTGKSPSDVMNGLDLPQWVASIVNEEWTNEVFDLDLTRDASPTTEDELLNTLKLALHCVDPSPEARPEIQQVLQQLEEIKAESAAESGDDGNGAPSTDH